MKTPNSNPEISREEIRADLEQRFAQGPVLVKLLSANEIYSCTLENPGRFSESSTVHSKLHGSQYPSMPFSATYILSWLENGEVEIVKS